METNPVQEREQFARDAESGQWTMSELCERYGVSRTTGYKWLERFRQQGEQGLRDRKRVPRHIPHRTSPEIEQLILEEADKYRWGARKVLVRLQRRYPEVSFPARSTVFDILKRHGRVTPNRRRKRWKHPGAVPLQTSEPNQVWTADFKGHFRTGNRIYCYPLTIQDHYSRYLLGCQGMLSPCTETAKPAFERLFREVGLPEAIRTDNGPPFASTGIHGLCQLNVWWLKLGIAQQRIDPASPQQNGAHERMHKTLKGATAKPPAANLNTQQRAFNRFRTIFNEERPHEAIDDDVPASRWRPSPRPMPSRIEPPDYPAQFEVRRVSNNGAFRLFSSQVFLSQALAGENVGFEEIDDGLWNIVFYDTLLGRYDQETSLITGAPSLR